MTLSALSGSIDALGRASGGIPGDPDVVAFLSATGISDATQISAITTLVASLKTASLWTKLHAFWPIVGGVGAAHRYNLKDPRDLDAAFRLTFMGTWVHDARGATADGGSAYADTHLAPTTVLGSSSGSLGIYVTVFPSDGGQNMYDLACDDDDTNPVCCISRYHDGNSYTVYGDSAFAAHSAESTALGLTTTNRLSGTTTGYRNGANVVSGTPAVVMPSSTLSLFLGGDNRGGTMAYPTNRSYGTAFVGDGLTGTEQSNLYVAMQSFQTTLGRAV